jgi:hypothetical protein
VEPVREPDVEPVPAPVEPPLVDPVPELDETPVEDPVLAKEPDVELVLVPVAKPDDPGDPVSGEASGDPGVLLEPHDAPAKGTASETATREKR